MKGIWLTINGFGNTDFKERANILWGKYPVYREFLEISGKVSLPDFKVCQNEKDPFKNKNR
jgi:hypothetical protein